MRKILLLLSGLALSASALYADVTETVTTKVTFGSSGTLTSTSTTCYKGLIKADVSESDFEGSGLSGKMIGMFFPKGRNGTIHNLPEKNVYGIDYAKKSYTVSQIEKFFQESQPGASVDTDTGEDSDSTDEETRFRVIRSEFRVIDTGEKKKTSGFDTHEYQIVSVYEIEDLATKIITTDSLFVDLWNTDDTGVFDRANAEKSEFNRELLALMGIEFEEADYERMLGLNWMKIMQSADVKAQMSEKEQSYDVAEMKKIEGYPVIIDGHMFSKTFDPNKPQDEAVEEDGGSEGIPTSVGGLAGRFGSKLKKKAAKKLEKKEPSPDEYRQVLAYYMETGGISFDAVPDDRIAVPEGFKLKK